MDDDLEAIQDGDSSEEDLDVDSLFDSVSPTLDFFPTPLRTQVPNSGNTTSAARRTKPPISGIFFDPSILIPTSLALQLEGHTQGYFHGPRSVNQVMLFGRATEAGSGLPPFLDNLILELSDLLKTHLPTQAHELLFPPAALASRQVIINHYIPGEGITPHIDLLTRFSDGILAVSLGSGTVMTFRRAPQDGGDCETRDDDRWDVYLPERSVLVLTGDARYKWSHGIDGQLEDCVEGTEGKAWLKRGIRVSITLRWLLPGADIVGGLE